MLSWIRMHWWEECWHRRPDGIFNGGTPPAGCCILLENDTDGSHVVLLESDTDGTSCIEPEDCPDAGNDFLFLSGASDDFEFLSAPTDLFEFLG